MALDLPDLGNLRSSLSSDLLEDEEPQPNTLPRRVSRRGVMSLQLPWYLCRCPRKTSKI